VFFYEVDMKYFYELNMEWDYDDLESTELLFFSAPDDFEFGEDKTEAYCKFKKFNYEKKKFYAGKFYFQITNEVPYGKKGKTKKVVWRVFSLGSILSSKNALRDELIEWLEKTYNVVQIKAIEIENEQ
jgi:hypothetical protein